MATKVPGREAAKAYVGAGLAAAAAGLAAAGTALSDEVVTAQEWTVIIGAVVVSLGTVFGGVYATRNSPPE